MNLSMYRREIHHLKIYIISIVAIIALSYSIYLFCSDDTVRNLGHEDGFFEWMTAVLFLVSSIIFFLTFLRNKNIFILGLALIFFVGAGEEISWGQRVLDFSTPESLNKINAQHEFNIHNLEMFNSNFIDGTKKAGFQRLLEINMLFRIFSMAFLIFIPLYFYHLKPPLVTNQKIQMPVAPFTMGIFFLISWAIFYVLKYFILPRDDKWGYDLSAGEVFEATAAFVYFTVAVYFYRNRDNLFLGKDIKTSLA